MQKNNIATLVSVGNIHRIKEIIIKIKVRFDRGLGLINYAKYIIYPLGIKLAIEDFNLFLITGILLTLSGYFIGYIDEKYGIWIQESRYLIKKIQKMKYV